MLYGSTSHYDTDPYASSHFYSDPDVYSHIYTDPDATSRFCYGSGCCFSFCFGSGCHLSNWFGFGCCSYFSFWFGPKFNSVIDGNLKKSKSAFKFFLLCPTTQEGKDPAKWFGSANLIFLLILQFFELNNLACGKFIIYYFLSPLDGDLRELFCGIFQPKKVADMSSFLRLFWFFLVIKGFHIW